MTNVWNKNEIITPNAEYNLVYKYNKHLSQVQAIKEQPMIIEKPFHKKKIKVCKSQKLMDIKNPTSQENKILVQKILSINNGTSEYTNTSDLPIKPSNLGQKILEMRKLIEDNEGIERRIKQTSSVIKFDKIKQEYKQNKLYLKNLTGNSRRIYNCFVNRCQPYENKKQKKKTLKQQQLQDLKRLQKQQPQDESLQQQQQQQQQQLEESNNQDINNIKSKTNIDQDKLIYQLNELKLKENDESNQSD